MSTITQTAIVRADDRPTIVRSCKCLDGHEWLNPVTFSPNTQKLSGESHRYCPTCGKGEFTASPWQLLIGGHLYELTVLNRIRPE